MKSYQLLQIGTHHTNHCEDYNLVAHLSERTLLCAVMDGCTMGTDSYFAATLVGKLLRKIATEENYNSFYHKALPLPPATLLRAVMRQLMAELGTLKSQLLLNQTELLSTLLLAIVDVQERTAEVLIVGDGLVCINGRLTEYEQNNIPDYLGYHLAEPFDAWYDAHPQKLSASNVRDLSLSTDGIFTFSRLGNSATSIAPNPVAHLLIDQSHQEVDTMLLKKLLFLQQQCGLVPTDDLGIVRLIG
ncbi:protein phosphatase 2C domain-containing protein [Solirubrum puertoriconensis]|uniref:PPM-type phosphatase domain-containing protein n=1 Tax=Solirubrum puertoriconensis TaxID=1751427 RepID=A0A9X0HL35_SOLP1|nr:protein phosphatase 2C domain-containing protein [Solirubrum puertoriconensis]KUG07955.1 hypothetical protein ASU33_07020 [Solirubrum puertoriconensis]